VDVVLDYLWDAPALSLLKALKSASPVQWVQIGTLVGTEMSDFPAVLLRGKDVTIRASGPGAFGPQEMGREAEELVGRVGGLDRFEFDIKRLRDVEAVWRQRDRVVFVP
jgi:hypothetical protein